MNLANKSKSIAGFVGGAVTTLLAFWAEYQNMTLKQVVAALVAGLVTGVVVHQAPKNKEV